MRNILLKSIPYILCIVFGMAFFLLSEFVIENEYLAAFFNNIAATMSAIPIVFLVYDYSNYRLSARFNKILFDNISYEVNSIVLTMLRQLRDAMDMRAPLNWDMIQKLIDTPNAEIKKKVHVTKRNVLFFKQYMKGLDDLIYRGTSASVLSDPPQIAPIVNMSRELSHIINELEYRGRRDKVSEHITDLLANISAWFDACEEQAIKSHEHFILAEEQAEQKNKRPIRPITGTKLQNIIKTPRKT